ncbi:VIT1/CCC1 family predicted Fe2+/Mn2+ transporter [Sphingobium fontiphilum]|uniref:VIT1/CCC1 family predicted Fe2+/Mn2+ transporter n=1 Tax=Sphingobium fontiphilum TaxID=944425 RepID=A0A7W6DFZ4_9SPHN|nr:VIT family protein [Sphingobium fontiphilum]MBB3980576.1 VIT1/CCC1 family predicted Fe2+/Mn2+ transporter [Sphingobium fontiphilum]
MAITVVPMPHHEVHFINRVSWLRAAVLGANDGIVSTASLVVGIAASGAARESILLSGVAALVAGAMSMAAGEYVSVSAQADVEQADLAKEKQALDQQPEAERLELRDIYIERGLEPDLADKVATQLMETDALGAHARDELGITDTGTARPVQAAMASAASFAVGAAAPLLAAAIVPEQGRITCIAAISLLCLVLLGYMGARAGGARRMRSIIRTLFWGALAMAVTAGAGHLFGAVV